MSAAITITADIDDDPYSAFWADVSERDLQIVEQHFTGSSDWTLSRDRTDGELPTLFAYIGVDDQPPRLYLATEPAVVDTAADTVQEILQRGPDSLS